MPHRLGFTIVLGGALAAAWVIGPRRRAKPQAAAPDTHRVRTGELAAPTWVEQPEVGLADDEHRPAEPGATHTSTEEERARLRRGARIPDPLPRGAGRADHDRREDPRGRAHAARSGVARPVPTRDRGATRAARLDAAVAGLLALLAVLTLVVTMWIAIRSIDGAVLVLRDPLALGQTQALLAGLVSAHLMLVQVVLLARLPWLERAWGRPRLVRWHRSLALWSWWLLVLHVALFVLQRATRSPERLLEAWWALFVTEQYMLWATLGTALLALVLVSSLRVVRRRLRYETWHLLHLWSYASLGLALPHMLVSVDLVGWATAYWWTLYAVVLATLMGWRVVVPLVRSARLGLRVADVRPEAGGAVSVGMTGDVDRLAVRPGQFLVWRFLGGRGWTRGHPYSLSAAPGGGRVRVTIGGDGDGARHAAALRPGARVLVEGPYGVPLPGRRRHQRLLLVAAGVGVTPFRTLLEMTPFAPGEVTLVVRARAESDVVLGAELRELCGRRGVQLVVLAGPRRAPASWLPQGVEGDPADVLLELVPDLADHDVVLCGPPGWMAAVRSAAVRAGVGERDVTQEDFGW